MTENECALVQVEFRQGRRSDPHAAREQNVRFKSITTRECTKYTLFLAEYKKEIGYEVRIF